jgi:prepilin-type N-terminal cleavage/methylation domain-containing protein
MSRKGFTLLETVLAIALAAFFAYAGSISFSRLVPKFRLQGAVWEVESSLNQARFKAAWKGAPVRVRFGESSRYALEVYDGETDAWRLDRAAALEGVMVAANNAPVFHPQGTVSNLATITLSNSSGSYKITIAISGRIKAVKTG